MKSNRLSNIFGYGVLGQFSYTINYDEGTPGLLRLIYAPNGRGKTNFLRSVAAILTGDVDSLEAIIEIPIQGVRIEFEGGGCISFEREGNLIGNYVASVLPKESGEWVKLEVEPSELDTRLSRRMWEKHQNYIDFKEAIDSLSPGALFISANRLTEAYQGELHDRRSGSQSAGGSEAKNPIGSLLSTLEKMFTQLALAELSSEGASDQSMAYSNTTDAILSMQPAPSGSVAREQLENTIVNLLELGPPYEKYGLISLRQVRDIKDKISDVRSNHRNLMYLHAALMPYFDTLQEQINSLLKAQSLIDRYVTTINYFLDRKQLQFSSSRGFSLEGSDGESLDPALLSSGEQHLIYLITQTVLATKTSKFVIIDEPEISLGIDWQRDLLYRLLFCTEPQPTQILVASHSIQVMDFLDDEAIVIPGELE